MAMKANTLAIFNYLKEHNDEDLTAADLASILGLEKRSVDGSFTSGIQRKLLGVRVEKEIELADGSHSKVKYLHLTPAGMEFDPNQDEVAAD